MHAHLVRGFALLVLVATTPGIARAQAMSVPQGVKMCYLLTPSEAGRYLGKPVRAGESAGPASGCAFHAADGSKDGVLVTRSSRSDWYPPNSSYEKEYHPVSGVGEKAYTVFEPGLGYAAGVLSAKGVTEVQMSGNAPAAAALALARIAMNR